MSGEAFLHALHTIPERERHCEKVVVPLIRRAYYYYINAAALNRVPTDDEELYVQELNETLYTYCLRLCEVHAVFGHDLNYPCWFQEYGYYADSLGYYTKPISTRSTRLETSDCLFDLRHYIYCTTYIVYLMHHGKLPVPKGILQDNVLDEPVCLAMEISSPLTWPLHLQPLSEWKQLPTTLRSTKGRQRKRRKY